MFRLTLKRALALIIALATLSIVFSGTALADRKLLVHKDGTGNVLGASDSAAAKKSYSGIRFFGECYLIVNSPTNQDNCSINMHTFRRQVGAALWEGDQWLGNSKTINVSSTPKRLPSANSNYKAHTGTFTLKKGYEYYLALEAGMPNSVYGNYACWLSNQADGT